MSELPALDAPLPGALLVDARALHATGLGRYLRELLARWLAQPPFERFELLGDPDALAAFVREHDGAGRARVLPYGGAIYSARSQREWLAMRLHRELSARVGFFPHWDVPLALLPPRSVVTVHDLIHFRVPEAFSASRRAAAAPLVRHALRRAARVLCPSDATARDVASWMPSVRGKVSAVPNGVSERFFGEPITAAPVAGPYLLAVGNQKPHKNVAAAVDVLALLRVEHPALRLVVVGPRAEGHAVTMARAAQRGVADAVIHLDDVTDDVLHACYAGATALLFPSRYEGFGLPVAEAMAAGAPVVASNTPAVAEVVAGTAPVHAPDDVRGMADDVRRLMGDAAYRAARVAAGRGRAAELSWARAAPATGAALREVARMGRASTAPASAVRPEVA